MKVLQLNAYFQPEQIAFTHLEHDLLQTFTQEGISVEIITPTPTRGIDQATQIAYKNKKNEVLYDGKVKVERFWAPQEGKNKLVRMLRYFWCNYREYRLAMKHTDIDMIFAVSTPPTQGMLCALTAKKLSKKNGKKIPFVYNLQDVFPDSLVTAKMTKTGSLIWKIGRRIEDYTYKNADKIIVISDDFKQNLIKKGVPEEKIVLVPNWIDSQTVYPVSREENVLFDRLRLKRDKFYICYSGNIGHSQNIDLLIETSKELQNVNQDIIMLVIGEGAEKERLIAEIKRYDLKNILVFPFQPYEDIASVFSLGDADLIISKKGTGDSSVPSKTWSIMAAGRPVLASFDYDSELIRLLKQTGSGVFADADDLEGLLNGILMLYNDVKLRTEKGENGRRFVIEQLNKEICTMKYVNTIISAAKIKRSN